MELEYLFHGTVKLLGTRTVVMVKVVTFLSWFSVLSRLPAAVPTFMWIGETFRVAFKVFPTRLKQGETWGDLVTRDELIPMT